MVVSFWFWLIQREGKIKKDEWGPIHRAVPNIMCENKKSAFEVSGPISNQFEHKNILILFIQVRVARFLFQTQLITLNGTHGKWLRLSNIESLVDHTLTPRQLFHLLIWLQFLHWFDHFKIQNLVAHEERTVKKTSYFIIISHNNNDKHGILFTRRDNNNGLILNNSKCLIRENSIFCAQ